MPRKERVRASRVREICMHGLKRAEAVEQSAPPLLDFTDNRANVGDKPNEFRSTEDDRD
jgi:hypothetical protein